MSQEIIDHVQGQFERMSREQIIQMINFDPEIDLLLDEAIAIWDTQLSQPHQPQDQQQQAQLQQIHPPIPAVENHIEYNNSDTYSVSVYDDDPLDIVFANEIQTEFQPPITLINLQPTCSAFSLQIKLQPYFKQYSKGFHVALQAANLHLPNVTPTNFRIWTPFNLSKITPIEDKI